MKIKIIIFGLGLYVGYKINDYLKKENRKINGTSTNFWNKDDKI